MIQTSPTLREIESSSDDFGSAIKLEYRVFRDRGYIEPNATGRVREYDRFPRFYFFGYFRGDIMCGVSRVILAARSPLSREAFPTLADFEIEEPWERRILGLSDTLVTDIATLAILTEYRTLEGLRHFVGELISAHRQRNCVAALAALDERVFRVFRRLGLPLTQIGREKFYMGSVTVPCVLNVAKR